MTKEAFTRRNDNEDPKWKMAVFWKPGNILKIRGKRVITTELGEAVATSK